MYLLRRRKGRLFSGIATEVERRPAEHYAGGRSAKFTRAYPLMRLLAVRQVANRSAALKLEAALSGQAHAKTAPAGRRFPLNIRKL